MLLQEHNYEDEELKNDIEFLTERLQQALLEMSSFMEYAVEVRSGQ